MTISTGNSYLDSLSNSASASTTATKSNSTIDQAGFLKLLTTQMTMQDPTAPMDNNQMVQQMATFSQVAGTTQMNTTLSSMADNIAASRFGSASNWVGHAALVQSDIAAAASNGAFAGEITLPDAASDVKLTLLDSSGQIVHQSDLGAHDAGAVNWSWDGKDANGNAVAGPVQMLVSAPAATGTGSVTATNAAWTEIASVQSPVSGTTKLVTALGSFAPSDIQAVS
ncbi:flagellar hook capping FlgD N-terminal domain-containing protein [Sphingomonas sp. BIUV-7]|uniref:Basal-body rod modification protein FlgD n=1 Tax=Sphingomonas natans TaxID=3063330 RepID=A0ABT8YDX4_9SPHN|nr:flagellar hook capping FlgD N-terminal domain-containing protein [Sphingomonas sp. BIUV-7]MDO6416553.1 flagellar hook capping FlgD N-terminal domain-containing protein [Sphingomonas sp. BIUV-7]